MKAILLVSLGFVPIIFVPGLHAEDAADNIAIHRTIEALNQSPLRIDLFASDTNAAAELSRLPSGVLKLRIPEKPSSGQPTLTISKEPWGEATINLPGSPTLPTIETNSRIASGAIRYITSDVALAEGTLTTKGDGDDTRITPLLFVMKKEHDHWKIASIRVLVAH